MTAAALGPGRSRMSGHRVLVTARRVLTQLRHEPPTVIQIIVGPCLLLTLFRLIFSRQVAVFEHIGAPLLTVFPLITIYQATSALLLRERLSGTLERLMTTPMLRLELLLGYAGAFLLAAILQAAVATALVLGPLGVSVAGPALLVGLVAVSIGTLGIGLGLMISAVLRTELQVSQSMVLIVIPQVLLSGLIEPRQAMPAALHAVSDVLPLSYAVDAMHHLTRQSGIGTATIGDVLIVLGFALAALVAGAMTLRRQTD